MGRRMSHLLICLLVGLGAGCSDPRECECPSLGECQSDRLEDTLQAYLEDAIELQQLGHHEASLVFSQRVFDVDPNYDNVHFVRGFSQQMAGQHLEAITSYGNYLQIDPDDGQVWFNLGYAQMETGAHGAAVESFQQALAHDIPAQDVHFYLATCFEQLGRTQEAAEHRRLYDEQSEQ